MESRSRLLFMLFLVALSRLASHSEPAQQAFKETLVTRTGTIAPSSKSAIASDPMFAASSTRVPR
ncbi:hypothetical protein F3Y22_tig00010050pilonHSYRG00046 [Hibiscus syriacus]|uniref:Uncharacterized protein n=1 Tax=Hibiscus syriacus TaxID=106335 RepID=A0A6A3CA09_HIBSY|nr:hypothetical protein F3Y22_tig00010050pilonHSYRG00046 [Hibiscus syriacus]